VLAVIVAVPEMQSCLWNSRRWSGIWGQQQINTATERG